MTILFLCREDNAVREIAGYAQALRRRGIALRFVPAGIPLNAELADLVAQCPERPSIILHPDSDFPVMPRGLNEIAIPTALLQADPYAYTHRRLCWAMLFDYVLLLHDGFEEQFRAAGHPAPVTLPHAVDATYFEGPDEERSFEVSGVGRVDGASYRTRRTVFSMLEKEFRMNEWQRNHSYPELADVYRRTKIVVNIGRDDYPADVSLRFAEAMAAGALFVTLMPGEMTAMGFEEGIHFVGFREQSGLVALLRTYLVDKAARERIAEAGRAKVLHEHTYDVRVEGWLQRVAQDEGKLLAPARRWPAGRVRRIYLDYFAAHGALPQAAAELPKIARQSAKAALIGAALLGRAWGKRVAAKLRTRSHAA